MRWLKQEPWTPLQAVWGRLGRRTDQSNPGMAARLRMLTLAQQSMRRPVANEATKRKRKPGSSGWMVRNAVVLSKVPLAGWPSTSGGFLRCVRKECLRVLGLFGAKAHALSACGDGTSGAVCAMRTRSSGFFVFLRGQVVLYRTSLATLIFIGFCSNVLLYFCSWSLAYGAVYLCETCGLP